MLFKKPRKPTLTEDQRAQLAGVLRAEAAL